MNYETYILHLVGSSDAIDKLAGIINSAVASVGENNFRGFHADGVFRRTPNYAVVEFSGEEGDIRCMDRLRREILNCIPDEERPPDIPAMFLTWNSGGYHYTNRGVAFCDGALQCEAGEPYHNKPITESDFAAAALVFIDALNRPIVPADELRLWQRDEEGWSGFTEEERARMQKVLPVEEAYPIPSTVRCLYWKPNSA